MHPLTCPEPSSCSMTLSSGADDPGRRLSLVDEAEWLTALVRDRAATWLPDLVGPATVRRTGTRSRSGTRLHRFVVIGRGESVPLLVKLQLPTAQTSPRSAVRPRLAPPLAAEESYRLEYAALRAVEAHFTSLGDPRFATIRALDLLPEARAIVMLETPGRPLTRLMARVTRPARLVFRSDLRPIFDAAGAWLHEYQRMPYGETVQTRLRRREELPLAAHSFATYLAPRFSSRVLDRAVAAIEAGAAALPEELPLGLGHGDFAMRNILVEAGGRIAVLDTRARTRAPAYEDLARMLVALRANRPQALTQGWAFADVELEGLEAALLAGYDRSGEISREAVRLFELLVLLDLWAARAERRSRRGLADAASAVPQALVDRSLRRLVGRLSDALLVANAGR